MKRMIVAALALAALASLPAGSARADIKPHPLISDGMVLQRGMACPLWGTADPGEEVTANRGSKMCRLRLDSVVTYPTNTADFTFIVTK